MRANFAGKALPDKPCRVAFLLRGNAAASASAEAFRKHWAHIMTSAPEEPKGDRLDEETNTQSDKVKFAYEDFVNIINRLKMGRAGGDDGVAAEFLRALPPHTESRLWTFVRGILLGKIPVPHGIMQV